MFLKKERSIIESRNRTLLKFNRIKLKKKGKTYQNKENNKAVPTSPQKNKNVIFCTKFIDFQNQLINTKNQSYQLVEPINEQNVYQHYIQNQYMYNDSHEQLNIDSSIKCKNNAKRLNNKDQPTQNINKIDILSNMPQNNQKKYNNLKEQRNYMGYRLNPKVKTFKSFMCDNNNQMLNNSARKQDGHGIKFKNLVLSTTLKMRQGKLSHSAKISKCLTLSQFDQYENRHKKINLFPGMQIMGVKAPSIEIVDHFRLKSGRENATHKIKSDGQQLLFSFVHRSKNKSKNI